MAHEARSHGPGSEIRDDGGIRQHKGMAMTGKVGGMDHDFGVGALPGTARIPHPEGEPSGKLLSDEQRSGPPGIEMGRNSMDATAHSYHGPHLHPKRIHDAHMPKGKRPHHV